ncbi:CapA family protein [Micromonospora sp. NPDC051296]|uniref:CapA family protein n=1 Tax=Micromonospora sp. NPDC051296 TaxID=3155046 RepID=UPI00342BE344
MPDGDLTIFLGGDVMTGRGVDQILPRPGSPELRERAVGDARQYVALAESASGPIPRPADPAWPWGDLRSVLAEAHPDVRLVNLETAVTRRGSHASGKAIHYRMHPDNIACLTAARLDVCALANNHVLDFGVDGLAETHDTLLAAGIRAVGAGPTHDEAWAPARLDMAAGRRLLVWSVAAESSGVPPGWAATGTAPGVALLPEVSEAGAGALLDRIGRQARPGDLIVVSVHWGSNWGYDVDPEQVAFAHRLIDGGVHVVHGHSSHHPRPVEIYRGRLVLYGCGDLIDDYEGIEGYESYRPELRLAYFATLDADGGALRRLRMVPMRMRRMRLEHAAPPDVHWLADVVGEVSRPFGTRIVPDEPGLRAEPAMP